MHDVVIVGSGVIGLAIAREVCRNRSVVVLERGPVGEGTSWAAAGMLSPQSEADHAGPFFEFSRASFNLFEKFTADLKAESGIDPGYERSGLLVLASTAEESAVLRLRAEWQQRAGFSAKIIDRAEALEMEPLLTADFRDALYLPDDQQVTPRRLVAALAESCRRRGVEIRSGTPVTAVLSDAGRVTGVIGNGNVIPARQVVLAAGVWSGTIDGLAPKIPVYPRKGQILSLQMPERTFRHMIRWRHAYFVPRPDGDLVVGATDENVGFDRSVTPAGIGRLLADAQEISSNVGSYAIRETWSGLRPGTPDELPIIGESALKGLIYAAGHYRNGILLAPLTSVIIAALIEGTQVPAAIDAFSPMRWTV
jgi:glycine oxidase